MSARERPTVLAITGMGMVTPVGGDAMSSSLAIQAGISRLAALDEFPPQSYWNDGGEALQATGVAARPLTAGLLGVGRLVKLAAPPLAEALAQARVNPKENPAITLLQAVPPAGRPERDDRIEELFPRRLERLCGLAPGQLHCRFIDEGHAGMMTALAQAAELLAQNQGQEIAVGGVDSLVEPPTLQWLEQAGRLKAGTRVDGLMPGEAAGYLLVETPEEATRRGKPVLAFLSGVARATEPNTVWTNRPSVGVGLSEAVRQTIGPLKQNANRIRLVIGDLNGERYRAMEWSYAEIRAFNHVDVHRRLWHHADCVGDTGCASGAVSLVYAVAAIQAGLADSDVILVFSSADDGQRASVLVSGQSPVSMAA